MLIMDNVLKIDAVKPSIEGRTKETTTLGGNQSGLIQFLFTPLGIIESTVKMPTNNALQIHLANQGQIRRNASAKDSPR